ERASPRMMVADASTFPVVREWPRAKRDVGHWYQLGDAPAAGFTALSTLYSDGEPPPAADVAGDDPFAVISTAAVDVIPRVSGLDAPPTIQRLHDETQAQFWTGFGQSETTGFVSIQRVRDRPGAAGRPIPVCRVRLVDDYDREVETGAPGEIVVRGPVVFQGYFGQPDVTAYTLRNGWHHTGDVGRFDDEGWLYYVRRKPEKELIKPGGEN